MNTTTFEQPSFFMLLIGGLILAGCTLGSLILFVTSTYSLVNDLVQGSDTVVYKSSSWALFGVGLALTGLSGWVFIERLTGRPPKTRLAKGLGRSGIAGLLSMAMLPVIGSIGTQYVLSQKGYKYCEAAGYPYHLPGLGERVYIATNQECVPWEQSRGLEANK